MVPNDVPCSWVDGALRGATTPVTGAKAIFSGSPEQWGARCGGQVRRDRETASLFLS